MRQFIRDYHQRLVDIEQYFDFVEFLDSIETHKQSKIVSNDREFKPSRDLQKVLRSNCFMLLYNLIESSIRNGILAIYDQIHDDDTTYENLSNRLKEIWLNHRTKQLHALERNIKPWLRNLVTEVTERPEIKLDKDSININGNLDFKNIQKIISAYGFFGSFSGDMEEVVKSLNRIKVERNLLAHGNKTFSQAGEIVTMSELINIKETVKLFLSELIQHIDKYIDDKAFKK